MNKKVAIWECKFTDNEKFKKYIKEAYTDDGDMSSEFMAAYKIDFIDNQFQEVLFLSDNISHNTLLEQFSYSESFMANVTLQEKSNSIIAIYNYEYTGSITEDKHSHFVGNFEYTED